MTTNDEGWLRAAFEEARDAGAEALKELNGLLYDLNTAVDEHATPQLVRNQRKAILEFLEVFGLGALEPVWPQSSRAPGIVVRPFVFAVAASLSGIGL